MTIIRDIDQTCPVCGKQSSQKRIYSICMDGYSYLDFRQLPLDPELIERVWLMECPECGYVGKDFSMEAEIPMDLLKSDAYKSCEGHEFKVHPAEKFYRRYMIERELNSKEGCFSNLHHCAWVCDDSEDENAVEIRKMALKFIDDLVPADFKDEIYLSMVKADMLRRTGQFDKLINEFSDVVIGEEDLDAGLQFQLEKARQKDAERYDFIHALAEFGKIKDLRPY